MTMTELAAALSLPDFIDFIFIIFFSKIIKAKD